VALKISSADVLHKSDVGGVRLNLDSPEAVEKAYEDMLATVQQAQPEAKLGDVLVSRMAPPGLEVIVGMNRDPQFGPIILFGLGGIMVEIFQDVSLRLLPFSRDDALGMIREIKGYGLISGYRGQPPVDEEALTDCLLSVAQMAENHPKIVEIDLNPVMAYPDGILVVDARIIEEEGN
jgi:acyl-CoA synthetase (NDP forming)